MNRNIPLFFFILFAMTCCGCQLGSLIGILGTPAYNERFVEAEYDLTENKEQKIAVLVNQPPWLQAGFNIRYYLTKAINSNLVKAVKISEDNIIGYEAISKLRSSRDDFSLLGPVDIGKALGVDILLAVKVEDYKLGIFGEPELYNGRLDTQVVLFDVGSGKRLWPKNAVSKAVKVGFEIEDRGLDVAYGKLAAASAYCTTRYFYDCPKAKFRIAEDRSGIGWQEWK